MSHGGARQLLRHQIKCLDWCARKSSIPLFLEMRLGKTLIAIKWASQFPCAKLVVCPLSVVYTWQSELRLESIKSTLLLGTETERLLAIENGLRSGHRWFIVNYEALFTRTNGKQTDPSILAILPWQCVILDESPKIRNPKTHTSKVCTRYLSRAQYKACLSGLPNPESPLDFFPQMEFLFGQFLGHRSYWRFRAELFQRACYDWTPRKGTRKLIQQAVNDRAYILTRKEARMPGKRIMATRYVFLPKKVKRDYDLLERSFALRDMSTKWATVKWQWLHRIAGGQTTCGFSKRNLPSHNRKITEILDLLSGELSGQQILIWYCYNLEGESVTSTLQNKGFRVGRIHGGVSPTIRNAIRDNLVNGHLDIVVMQVDCGKYGLDFSCASTAIYFSEPASHDSYAQSLDRLIHPKKKEPALVISILAKDTVDEDIHIALQGKRLTSAMFRQKMKRKVRKRYVTFD